MRSSQRSRAFTLVEMLVVIAIITVLAALLFPVFQRARKQTKGDVCLSNLRQMGVAINLYAADYDDKIPYAPDASTKWGILHGRRLNQEPLRSAIKTMPDITEVLLHYGAIKKLFHCPCDFQDGLHPVAPTYFAQVGSSYTYNEDKGFVGRTLSGFPDPANNLLMYDIDGSFHGGSEYKEQRQNNLFADMHVKLRSHDETTKSLDADP